MKDNKNYKQIINNVAREQWRAESGKKYPVGRFGWLYKDKPYTIPRYYKLGV